MDTQLKSDKKYALAVILSGIFGIFGIHHFYCGRISHGFFDLGLSISAFLLINTGSQSQVLFGVLLLAIDVIHTIVVTFMLLVGNYKDGDGKIIAYPGQKLKYTKEIV